MHACSVSCTRFATDMARSGFVSKFPLIFSLLVAKSIRAVNLDDFPANVAADDGPWHLTKRAGLTPVNFSVQPQTIDNSPTSVAQQQDQINALLKFNSLPNLSSSELENLLYRPAQPYTQHVPNLASPKDEKVSISSVELPRQQLPDLPGLNLALAYTFPDSRIDNQLNNTREIHSFTTQRRMTNIRNHVVRRYQKTLNVNTIYNTNIQRINHRRLVNTLVNTIQEIKQPTVLVKYTRQNIQHESVRDEPTEVEVIQGPPQVLPPLTLPASVVTVGKTATVAPPLPGVPNSADLPPVQPWSAPDLTDDRIQGFVNNPGFDTDDLAREGFDPDRARRDPNYVVPQGVWDSYKALFDKHYFDGEEDRTRRRILTESLVEINAHNDRYRAGLETYTLAANQFSDQTTDEFNLLYNGSRAPGPKGDNGTRWCNGTHMKSDLKLPTNVNWAEMKVVSPIQYQDQPKKCASCWAFSASGAVESQLAIKNKQFPVLLSKQNLIDCSTKQGNRGCTSGLMNHAFGYIIRNPGINKESAYQYEARNGRCRLRERAIAATIKACKNIPFSDENALDDAIANVGPVSIVYDADNPDFRSYKNGIYNPRKCSPTRYTHGMLAIGYGQFQNGTEYYILKNSYGQFWGVDGYGLVSRHKNNACGIASLASYPVV